jgi:hypothetical protein
VPALCPWGTNGPPGPACTCLMYTRGARVLGTYIRKGPEPVEPRPDQLGPPARGCSYRRVLCAAKQACLTGELRASGRGRAKGRILGIVGDFVSTETVYSVEHGKRQPSVRTLGKIARALDVNDVNAKDLFS